MLLTPVVIVLMSISIVGAIAIPFGDPQFLDRAILLELSFIALSVIIFLDYELTVRGIPLAKLALYTCIPLAVLVIVGNSLAPPHVEIMRTFSKPLNAVVLIIGGYALQVALIATTIVALKGMRQSLIQKQKN
ncbi:MAG: hypothetical protein M3270_05225 [Thermoproteota archaeon]|nr:hypothetical protein [Thermoproteota archaeon]